MTLLEEGEQFRIDSILKRRAHAVGRSFIDDELGVLDNLRREQCRIRDRHDLVVAAIWGISRHIAEATIPEGQLARRTIRSPHSPARR